ncbi:MAG: hypothetical protein O3B04_09665 [Chloroflexi bacterium]|nr:hypothetical protein [Chloroflexota bacterium]
MEAYKESRRGGEGRVGPTGQPFPFDAYYDEPGSPGWLDQRSAGDVYQEYGPNANPYGLDTTPTEYLYQVGTGEDPSTTGIDRSYPEFVGGNEAGGSGDMEAAKLAGLVDPAIFAAVVGTLDVDGGESISAVGVDPDGTIIVTVTGTDASGAPTTRKIPIDASTAGGTLYLQQESNNLARTAQELDEKFRRDESKINEELSRLNAEIATERIRIDSQIANGQLSLALETQNRIDEREKQGRLLERDLFNANMSHQRDVLNLERSRFDLERQQFLAELSSQPGNMLDFFNISRGLPTAGLGGPLPEGISRAVGLNPAQQANAGAVINPSVPLEPLGAVPQVGPEAASPASTFDISQWLSNPLTIQQLMANAAGGAPPVAGAIPNIGSGDDREDPGRQRREFEANVGAGPPQPEDPGGTGVPRGGMVNQPAAELADSAQDEGLRMRDAWRALVAGGTTNAWGGPLRAAGGAPPVAEGTADAGKVQTGQVQPQQVTQDVGQVQPLGGLDNQPAATQAAINEVMSAVGLSETGQPPQQVTQDVGQVQPGQVQPLGGMVDQQRFQLPPELLAVFGGGQASGAGELQLPDTGVPFLSPQQLAGMTPAGRELYEAIIRATGLRVEDFNFIGQQRAPTSGRQISRRV